MDIGTIIVQIVFGAFVVLLLIFLIFNWLSKRSSVEDRRDHKAILGESLHKSIHDIEQYLSSIRKRHKKDH